MRVRMYAGNLSDSYVVYRAGISENRADAGAVSGIDFGNRFFGTDFYAEFCCGMVYAQSISDGKKELEGSNGRKISGFQ